MEYGVVRDISRQLDNGKKVAGRGDEGGGGGRGGGGGGGGDLPWTCPSHRFKKRTKTAAFAVDLSE